MSDHHLRGAPRAQTRPRGTGPPPDPLRDEKEEGRVLGGREGILHARFGYGSFLPVWVSLQVSEWVPAASHRQGSPETDFNRDSDTDLPSREGITSLQSRDRSQFPVPRQTPVSSLGQSLVPSDERSSSLETKLRPSLKSRDRSQSPVPRRFQSRVKPRSHS